MNRREREEHPEESFDGGYHLYAEEKHRERVAKNSDRIAFAIKQFEKHDIEYTLKNEQTGHFHCRRKSDDRLFQFWAGTGKIYGYDRLRGIHSLIKLLEGWVIKWQKKNFSRGGSRNTSIPWGFIRLDFLRIK